MASTVHCPHFGSTTYRNNRLIGVQTWPKCKWLKYWKSSPVGAHKSPTVQAGRGKFVGLKENLCGLSMALSLSKFGDKPHGKNRAKRALCAIPPENSPTYGASCWWCHSQTTWPFSRGSHQLHFPNERLMPSCSQKELRCCDCTPMLNQGKCS